MASAPYNATAPVMDISDRSFLIIDDFHEIRSIFRDILRSYGVNIKKIFTASNGMEAISHLRKRQFDMVLCDLNLGAGKNGQQILEEARVKALIEPTCIWVIISAEKTSESVTGNAEYQPDAYLLKPINAANLRQRLDKIWAKKSAFEEIHQAIRKKNYTKAISLCDERIDFDRANSAELSRIKFDLLLNSGEMDRAKELLESVLAERNLPWASTGMAKILIKNNDLSAAKFLLKDVLIEHPSFLEAHDLLAKTLQDMGDLEGTNSALEKAIALSPNSVIRQKKLGDVALKIGKLENAEKAFRKSVSLGEHSVLKNADAYIGLAKTCHANENSEEALKILNKLNKNFDDENIHLKATAVEGVIHHHNGNLEMAQQIAAKLGELVAKEDISLDAERSMEIARLLMATGDKENATVLLQREIKNNPENKYLLKDVTEIFVQAGMGDEGALLIETSRKEAVEIMNSGVLLVSKGQYKEAINAMRNARQAMPTNVRVLLNSAYVLITYIQENGPTQEIIAEARESLYAANTLSPGEPRFSQLTNLLNELTST